MLATGDIETYDDGSVAAFSRETGQYRVLVEGGSNPRYSASGHLLYARDGAILAVPFDKDTLEVRGTPVTVVDDVETSPIYGHAEFAISRDGTLVYARGGALADRNRVVWVNPDGQAESLIDEERAYAEAYLSPDGQSLALSTEGANPIIWIYDIARGTMVRFSKGFDNDFPVWTPDGRRVTFRSNRNGPYDIYWQLADGSGAAELLLSSDRDLTPHAWSPDGRVLAYTDRGDIWIASLERNVERTKLLGDAFIEALPTFSPDGRWLAYQSNETGRFEIYLRTFPDLGRKWPVSIDGGQEPRFSRDGRRLFFRNGQKMMAVEIAAQGGPVRTRPSVLFERPFARATTYDVARDGRFVSIEGSLRPPPTEIVLVQHFFSELERLAPTSQR